jgi:hypothetical protein
LNRAIDALEAAAYGVRGAIGTLSLPFQKEQLLLSFAGARYV